MHANHGNYLIVEIRWDATECFEPRQTSGPQRCEYKLSLNTMHIDRVLLRILHLPFIN